MSKKPETAPKAAEKEPKSAPKTASAEPEAAPKAAESAPQKAEKSDNVQVKFLRSHPSYGYFPGDKATISRAEFDKVQKSGPFFEEI